MKKPVYLMVTQFFPTPESWRGAFCYDFARAVQRIGKYDVRVMVMSRQGGADYDYNGIHVLRCRDFVLKLGFGRMLLYPINRWVFTRQIRKAGIDPKDISVVHFHDVAYVGLASGLKKLNPQVKLMLHFHNGGHPFTVSTPHLGAIPVYSTLLYLFFRWSFELVDIPVFVSARQRAHFGKWFPKGVLNAPEDVLSGIVGHQWIRPVRLATSHVLHNGIDYTVFNCKGRVPSGRFTIGCVANVDPWKDQMTLLKAVSRLKNVIPDLRVVIIGSGRSLEACKEYVEGNGLADIVSFENEIDHLGLPEKYRSFDLFVIPSVLEGFCCSYMEAWGCGTPVMGCKGVCLDEAIPEDDQNRWLIEPRDDQQLAKLICQYWRHPVPQRMVHDYNIDKMVSDFMGQVLP